MLPYRDRNGVPVSWVELSGDKEGRQTEEVKEEDSTAGAWGLKDDMESSEMDCTKLIDSFIVLRFRSEPLAPATGQPCLTYDNKLDWTWLGW